MEFIKLVKSALLVGCFLATLCSTQAADVLFIVANSQAPSPVEASMRDRLQSNFLFNVTVADDNLVSAASANGKDLIIISGGCSEVAITNKFFNLPVPILCENNRITLSGYLGMVSGSGRMGGVTNLVITTLDHPLSAGLPVGPIPVFRSPDTAAYGNPNTHTVGNVDWDSGFNRKGIYGFETGAQMHSIIAPARRTLVYSLNLPNMTAAGKALLDAALLWSLGPIGETNSLPVISFNPGFTASFHSTAEAIQFSVSTKPPNTLPSQNIQLFLNGSNVSSGLIISGNITNRSATFANLLPNILYHAQIVAADDYGRNSSFNWTFDTFDTNSAVVVETEDYNYGTSPCNLANPGSTSPSGGGNFQNNPPPSGYTSTGTTINGNGVGYLHLVGTPDIDFSDLSVVGGSLFNNVYRFCDPVGTRVSLDTKRSQYQSSDLPEYELHQMQAGEWLNYTRVFPTNTFVPYLRVKAGSAQQIRLDRVISDPHTGNQSTFPLGVFTVPASIEIDPYQNLPLTDILGNTLSVYLAGTNTLRLTALGADFNIWPNYLVFAPASSNVRPPSITFSSPTMGASNLSPDISISINILNGSTSVDTSSINLILNGTNLAGAFSISNTLEGSIINYTPPGWFPYNIGNTIILTFKDNAAVPASFTNQWSFFTEKSIPVLSTAYATAPGTAVNRGFNLHVKKVRNDWPLTSQIFADYQQQLADTRLDSTTGQIFFNEAGGPQYDGLYTEPDTINYEQAASPVGFFSTASGYPDRSFPGVDPLSFTNQDPEGIAMEVTAYLELPAGIQRFGVRSDEGFILTAKSAFSSATSLAVASYNLSRTDSPTEFEFLVETNGVYAFRLFWWESKGGASLEFYSVNRQTLQRTLINDSTHPDAIKAYRTRTAFPPLAAPQLTSVTPTNNVFFYPAASNLTFTAMTGSTNSFVPGSVQLRLNNIDYSQQLLLTGNNTNLTATFSELLTNKSYEALIILRDDSGKSTTNAFSFDTFVQSNTLTVEAEDYNFGGGLFIDAPTPSQYLNFVGKLDVDYSDTSSVVSNATFNQYRPADWVSTQLAQDTLLRPGHGSGGEPDFQIWRMTSGDWINYTRTFPSANYMVYLRASSTIPHELRFDQITSDPSATNQTKVYAGSFLVPATGPSLKYSLIPLTDGIGNPLPLPLQGIQTLRLTAVGTSTNAGFNYLLFVPVGPLQTNRSPLITSINPKPNTTNFTANSFLSFVITNRFAQLDTNSLLILQDGVPMAGYTVTSTASNTSVNLKRLWPVGPHTLSVIYQDNDIPPTRTTNQFDFNIVPYAIPFLTNPTRTGNSFTFSFIIQGGWAYIGEYKTSLPGSTWTPLFMVTTTGGSNLYTTSPLSAGPTNRFYRIRME